MSLVVELGAVLGVRFELGVEVEDVLLDWLEVVAPGVPVLAEAALEPGGQLVVALGDMLGLVLGLVESGGMFGLVGLVGLLGVFGMPGLLLPGAAVAATEATPNTNPAKVIHRYLMMSSL